MFASFAVDFCFYQLKDTDWLMAFKFVMSDFSIFIVLDVSDSLFKSRLALLLVEHGKNALYL